MGTVGAGLIIALLMISSGNCYCPVENMHRTGECGFRFQCTGNVGGIRLPEQCQGSTNYHITVDLTLDNATERFDEHIDTEFLFAVTSFRASGSWSETNLSLLQYMLRLQNLYLVGINVKNLGSKPFYLLTQLEILDLSRNLLSDISDLFKFDSLSNKLKKLNLAYNHIEQISEYALEELELLVELDFSNNEITTLDEQSFSNLTSLEILKLNNNKIKDLNGAFDNLHKLKHLYLRGNEIFNVSDESLKVMDHLETFDISWNHLEKLTPDILIRHWDHFGSHSVCKMTLSGNFLTSVPNATPDEYLARFTRSSNRLKSVDISTELDLSSNEISNIEYSAFRSLLRLTNLDLSDNKLITFNVDPDTLSFVKYLNLSTNSLVQLYFESFTSMTNLQNLDLSNNELDGIPDYTFSNSHNLRLVNMSYNDFTVLKNIHIRIFHPEGGVLDLSYNGLSRLAIPSGEAFRMTTLLINSNNISDAMYVNLQFQRELKHLEMSKNFIQHLNSSSLNLPVSLSYLDLSNNQIKKIGPGTFYHVAHLKTLRLDYNQLEGIEYGSFQGLTSLLNLNLCNNKITYLDSKLLMDLKYLSVLSLSYNNMVGLDYRGWLDHKLDLKVHIDGNNFTCDWLGTALNDFHNNFSKMKPCVLSEAKTEHSLEGIPCIQQRNDLAELRAFRHVMTNEERLLAVNLKILAAIKDQTYYIKKYMSQPRAISDYQQ